ncbi:hypothetical protein FSOLCH5_007923 [Fusarium solani]
MASEPFDRFRSSLKSYFNQSILSDLSVTCDGQTFKVHRLILCAHSKYFSKQLNGPWKESSEQVINIQDFDVGVVEAMLHFMYNFDYTNVNGTSSMVFEAQVYQIADKYGIDSLKEHATKRFGAALDIGWPMDDFPLAITVAYTTSPLGDRGLRDLIIETSSQHIDDLLDKGYFCERSPRRQEIQVSFMQEDLFLQPVFRRVALPALSRQARQLETVSTVGTMLVIES